MLLKQLDAGRRIVLLVLLLIIPIGFSTKYYNGPAAGVVNNALGGYFYVIFWCLLAYLIFKNLSVRVICLSVLLLTCVVEISQLWKPAFLEWLRLNFLGRTILGTSFAWSDFPYYFAGAVTAWLGLHALQKRTSTKQMSTNDRI